MNFTSLPQSIQAYYTRSNSAGKIEPTRQLSIRGGSSSITSWYSIGLGRERHIWRYHFNCHQERTPAPVCRKHPFGFIGWRLDEKRAVLAKPRSTR